MPKNKIRTELLERRKKLDASEIRIYSEQIFQNFLGSVEPTLPGTFETIALYAPTQGEVDSGFFFEHFRRQDKTCVYPRVNGELLDFLSVGDLSELKKGTFGTHEPNQNAKPGKPDLMLIPGVAFSMDGHRLGFGRGYYDRAIRKISPRPFLIALAYEFQLLDNIPAEMHDQKVDLIITDQRVILCQR